MGDPFSQLPPPSLPQPDPPSEEPEVAAGADPDATTVVEAVEAGHADPTAQVPLVSESSEPPAADEFDPAPAEPTQQIPLIQEATPSAIGGEYAAPSYATPEYSAPAALPHEYAAAPMAFATAPATKKKSNGWIPWVLALVLAGTTAAFVVLWMGKSGDLDDAKKANASVTADIADADRQISDLEATQSDLETSAAALESDKADLQAQLDAATNSGATASDDLAAATAQVDELTSQVDDLTTQITDLTTQSADLQTQLDTAKADLETAVAAAEVGPALTSVPFFSITVGQAVASDAAATITDDQAKCMGAYIIDEIGLAVTVESSSSDDVIQQQVTPAANACGVDPALFAVG